MKADLSGYVKEKAVQPAKEDNTKAILIGIEKAGDGIREAVAAIEKSMAARDRMMVDLASKTKEKPTNDPVLHTQLINLLTNKIEALTTVIKEKPTSFECEVKRFNGLISSIIIKPK